MTESLWSLSLVALATTIGLGVIARRVPHLPLGWPMGSHPTPIVLLKPVLAHDPETLRRCRAWMESAARYPGRAGVVFTTVAASAGPLEKLSLEQPTLPVRIVVATPQAREKEVGVDKANRLAAAEAIALELLDADDGILLVSDEDVEPVDASCVERLAASVTRPGVASSLIYPAEDHHDDSWWRCVATTNMRFNNAVYAAGNIALARHQGIVLGWTATVWASDLCKAGGFAATTSFQSEDVALGRNLASSGISTRLFHAADVIRLLEAASSLRAMWAQHVRWRSQLRGCHPRAVAMMSLALPLAAPVLLAAAACSTRPSPGALAVFVAVIAVTAWSMGVPLCKLWTLPVHELLAVSSQVAGLFARRVVWGPFVYKTDRRGRVTDRMMRTNKRDTSQRDFSS